MKDETSLFDEFRAGPDMAADFSWPQKGAGVVVDTADDKPRGDRDIFLSCLEGAMRRVCRDGGALQLQLLEIDRLADIRDSYGAPVAERITADFSLRLRESLDTADLLAHLDTDRFAIVVAGADHAREAARIELEMGYHYTWAESAVLVAATCGVVRFAGGDEPAANLLERAEAAVEIAALTGASRYVMP